MVVGYETDTHDELCIGVDIMRMKLPRSTTLEGFVDIMTDQVRSRYTVKPNQEGIFNLSTFPDECEGN